MHPRPPSPDGPHPAGIERRTARIPEAAAGRRVERAGGELERLAGGTGLPLSVRAGDGIVQVAVAGQGGDGAERLLGHDQGIVR